MERSKEKKQSFGFERLWFILITSKEGSIGIKIHKNVCQALELIKINYNQFLITVYSLFYTRHIF